MPLLNAAKIAAINFHPGSPDYPGTGCYNFALYEKAAQYGITCHHMKEKVDTGSIIAVSYFDIAPNESVETLKLKSMNHMLLCFNEIIGLIYNGQATDRRYLFRKRNGGVNRLPENSLTVCAVLTRQPSIMKNLS